jgi:DHA3 family macrolide efflux protein-like MFS transporter
LIADVKVLPAANGLLDSTDRIARLLGPGLVALLAGWLPLVHFLTLDAASFLASATAIALIAWLRPVPRATQDGAETIGAAIARGFRAMRRHSLLRYVLGSTLVTSGAWYPAMFLGLPLAIEHLVHAPGASASGGAGLSAYGW